jgi:YesN/AraC family two-component response regulator
MVEEGAAPPVSLLLVEDEELALKLLATILGKRFPGVAIFPASDGKAGLRVFEEHKPDIVITDINMPEMSGIQMTRRIRLLNPGVKIIALTAVSKSSDPDVNGMDHYIPKPINFAALIAAISDCLAELAHQSKRVAGSAEHQG